MDRNQTSSSTPCRSRTEVSETSSANGCCKPDWLTRMAWSTARPTRSGKRLAALWPRPVRSSARSWRSTATHRRRPSRYTPRAQAGQNSGLPGCPAACECPARWEGTTGQVGNNSAIFPIACEKILWEHSVIRDYSSPRRLARGLRLAATSRPLAVCGKSRRWGRRRVTAPARPACRPRLPPSKGQRGRPCGLQPSPDRTR